MNDTIIEAAVEKGLPRSRAEIEAQMVTLLRQVGNLEERNAALEHGIDAISAQCGWRQAGACFLNCPGRAFCNVKGLQGVCLVPSPQPKSPLTPLCKGGEGEGDEEALRALEDFRDKDKEGREAVG